MIVLLVILGLVILLVLIGIGYQNKFVKLQERVKNSWSQIDVQLQKRFDLIPNLVEVVKGYATHEKETLERVVAARTHYTTAGTVDEKIKASESKPSRPVFTCLLRYFCWRKKTLAFYLVCYKFIYFSYVESI